jgi:hypothetical protein
MFLAPRSTQDNSTFQAFTNPLGALGRIEWNGTNIFTGESVPRSSIFGYRWRFVEYIQPGVNYAVRGAAVRLGQDFIDSMCFSGSLNDSSSSSTSGSSSAEQYVCVEDLPSSSSSAEQYVCVKDLPSSSSSSKQRYLCVEDIGSSSSSSSSSTKMYYCVEDIQNSSSSASAFFACVKDKGVEGSEVYCVNMSEYNPETQEKTFGPFFGIFECHVCGLSFGSSSSEGYPSSSTIDEDMYICVYVNDDSSSSSGV